MSFKRILIFDFQHLDSSLRGDFTDIEIGKSARWQHRDMKIENFERKIGKGKSERETFSPS